MKGICLSSVWIHVVWVTVLSATRVPLSHIFVTDVSEDSSSHCSPSHRLRWNLCADSDVSDVTISRPIGNSQALEYAYNHTLTRSKESGERESTYCLREVQEPSLLRSIRGGNGAAKIIGLGTCGLAWAFGLGLKTREKSLQKQAQRPKRALLTDPSRAVILQGFDWNSMTNKPQLYSTLIQEMPRLEEAGINVLWFPPPSSSADAQGYMPGRWYDIPAKPRLIEALIAARAHGVVSMVDVVLNHRTATRLSNVTGEWTSFESPAWEEWAVVRNDWKCPPNDKFAFCPSNCSCGAADSGENACFAPDIDHTHPQVQADVEGWLGWLREGLGFEALRLDNTKGYAPRFVAHYLARVRPVFAVGEYFDTNRDLLSAWLRDSSVPTPAGAAAPGGAAQAGDGGGGGGGGIGAGPSTFDFGMRYKLKDAVRGDSFEALMDTHFGPMLWYAPSRAVTFLDNHDTAGDLDDRFGTAAQIAQGYAVILTHPGVPCVFWGDWAGPNRDTIRQLIALRAQAGVSSRSPWRVAVAGPGLYAAVVGPADGTLAVKVGSGEWSPNMGLPVRRWQGAASGPGWAVWTRIPEDDERADGGK